MRLINRLKPVSLRTDLWWPHYRGDHIPHGTCAPSWIWLQAVRPDSRAYGSAVALNAKQVSDFGESKAFQRYSNPSRVGVTTSRKVCACRYTGLHLIVSITNSRPTNDEVVCDDVESWACFSGAAYGGTGGPGPLRHFRNFLSQIAGIPSHSVNSSSHSVNGDIAIQWEWSNFEPS